MTRQWIDVLEPQSLADEIVEWHKGAIERYKKNEKTLENYEINRTFAPNL